MRLISSPLSLELEHLIRSLRAKGLDLEEKNFGTLKTYHNKEIDWFFSTGGHGKVQFALQNQFLLDQVGKKVDLFICAGCCGSISEKIKTFDVVVGTETIEHDFNLKFIKRPLPAFKGSDIYLNKLKNYKSESFLVHFEKIASGDEDIVDTVRAKVIQSLTEAGVVAWEGAGAARVSVFNQIPFLEIRAVTDSADKLATADFKKNLPRAMEHISEVIWYLETI